jgi:hypothetical protein
MHWLVVELGILQPVSAIHRQFVTSISPRRQPRSLIYQQLPWSSAQRRNYRASHVSSPLVPWIFYRGGVVYRTVWFGSERHV